MLVLATALQLLDSLAKSVDVLNTAIGTGIEIGTISKAAVDNANLLAAIDDRTVQRDLTPVFTRRADGVRTEAIAPALYGATVQRALDRHFGSVGELNAFLTSQNARVHRNLRVLGFQLNAINVMPPVVDPMASYLGTGAGAGVFTAGTAIDTAVYGPAPLEVVIDAMGAAARTIRLRVMKYDGTVDDRDVVIAGATAPGTVIAVGGAGDRYVNVTDIATVAGGLGGDSLHVRSAIERVIAL